jgi:hypothetical protein
MKNGSKGIEIPWSDCIGTFRKFPFILYSRRPKGRLLVNQKKIGIIDQEILSCSPTVKEKIAFGNCTAFQVQIGDLLFEMLHPLGQLATAT